MEKLKLEFNKSGFCISKNFFSKSEILELDKKLKKFLELKSGVLKGRDITELWIIQ